jgi:hypothetical protein
VRPDAQRAHARRHGLAQFVRQNESGLVLHIEIAGEGEHAFALHLVAEHRNGHQVGPERQLVPGEQGARRHREIPTAGLAAPTWLTARAATVVTDPAGAVRTDRLAVRLRPSQAQKHVFRALLGHPGDFARTERTGGRGEKEVLSHDKRLDDRNIR